MTTPQEESCLTCKGAGRFESDNGPAPRTFMCDECGGAGVVEALDEAELARRAASILARMRADADPSRFHAERYARAVMLEAAE